MIRFRQVREIIFERRNEQDHRHLKLEEVKLQTLASAIHSAAGNRRGAAAASRIRLTKRDKDELPDTNEVQRLMPTIPGDQMVPAELAAAAFGGGSK
jgi:hypothetical protein